jgi:hypothetical protein
MTTWMIGGIAILVLLASLAGFVAVHDHNIAAAAHAEDKAAVDACKSNVATCMAGNESIVADCRVIGQQRDEQTQSVQDWKALAERAATVAQNNLNAAQSTLVQLSAAQKDARAKAGRPARAMTCEQTLAEIDADSKQFAAQRAILFPADALKVGK